MRFGAGCCCPWSQCRHHLAGQCVLDLAERDGMTLAEVSEVLHLSRERIRQIELSAVRKLREAAASLVED
jgi:DNA-directed RNA polymerase sigma subunit (sigma70/sigma32)